MPKIKKFPDHLSDGYLEDIQKSERIWGSWNGYEHFDFEDFSSNIAPEWLKEKADKPQVPRKPEQLKLF